MYVILVRFLFFPISFNHELFSSAAPYCFVMASALLFFEHDPKIVTLDGKM